MKIISKFAIASFLSLGLASLINLSPALAAATSSNQIIFDSFTGVYHLSRDSRGLSLLTSDETIVADFPASGFTGIKRVIPEKFQGHSVGVKVLNVTDAAGNPVPYAVASDTNNVTLTTGDPTITLNGSQTIRINYQTTGVIDLTNKNNQLLLVVNGRGWSEGFTKVAATLYIPSSFNSKIKGTPSCYTALNTTTDSSNCQINVAKTADTTIITSQVSPVLANQALVLKVDFQASTFTNNHSSLIADFFFLVAAFITAKLAYAYFIKDKRSRKR